MSKNNNMPREALEFYYQDTRQYILNVQRQMYKVIEKLIARSYNHDSSKYDIEESHIYIQKLF